MSLFVEVILTLGVIVLYGGRHLVLQLWRELRLSRAGFVGAQFPRTHVLAPPDGFPLPLFPIPEAHRYGKFVVRYIVLHLDMYLSLDS